MFFSTAGPLADSHGKLCVGSVFTDRRFATDSYLSQQIKCFCTYVVV